MAASRFTSRELRELRRSLRGKPVPSNAATRRTMRRLERTLQREFRAEQARRARRARLLSRLHAPFVELVSRDPRAAEAARMLGTLQPPLTRRPRPPAWGPVTPQLLSGSYVWIEAPPYDFEWRWVGASGQPFVRVDEDKTNGTMAIQLRAGTEGGNADGRAALGIYFRPFSDGLLQFRALAVHDLRWQVLSFGELSGHTDGWIGLIVVTDDGATPIKQRISLWSQDLDSLFGDNASDTGNASLALHSELPVVAGTSYTLWVWCGARVSGSGRKSPISGSGALAELFVTIPFMAVDYQDY